MKAVAANQAIKGFGIIASPLPNQFRRTGLAIPIVRERPTDAILALALISTPAYARRVKVAVHLLQNHFPELSRARR
jgi:hypothetical protein